MLLYHNITRGQGISFMYFFLLIYLFIFLVNVLTIQKPVSAELSIEIYRLDYYISLSD